jgi:hypothetical protein
MWPFPTEQAAADSWLKVQPLVSFIEPIISIMLLRQFLCYTKVNGCEFENKMWPNPFHNLNGCKQWYQHTAKPFFQPPDLETWHSEPLPSERKWHQCHGLWIKIKLGHVSDICNRYPYSERCATNLSNSMLGKKNIQTYTILLPPLV